MKHFKQDFSFKGWVRSLGWTLGVGAPESENIFFSEHGHVAYQIKGNETYNRMHVNICPYIHTLDPGMGSNGHNNFSFLLRVVMLHIKLKE